MAFPQHNSLETHSAAKWLAVTVAFTVLALLCGERAIKTEMGPALFINNGEGRALTLDLTDKICLQKARRSIDPVQF